MFNDTNITVSFSNERLNNYLLTHSKILTDYQIQSIFSDLELYSYEKLLQFNSEGYDIITCMTDSTFFLFQYILAMGNSTSTGIEIIQYYIENGFDVSNQSTGINFLRFYIIYSEQISPVILKLLISAGASVTTGSSTEISMSVTKKDCDIQVIEILLDLGSKPPSNCLLNLIESGNFSNSFVPLLIQSGVDINTIDDRSNSCLHLLLQYHNFDNESTFLAAISCLIDFGVDVNLINFKGNNALMEYCSLPGCYESIISRLLPLTTDINLFNRDNLTLLMLCLDSSHTNVSVKCTVLQMLIDAGADVNAVYATKWSGSFSVIERVIRNGKICFAQILKTLVDNKANIDVRDGYQNTLSMQFYINNILFESLVFSLDTEGPSVVSRYKEVLRYLIGLEGLGGILDGSDVNYGMTSVEENGLNLLMMSVPSNDFWEEKPEEYILEIYDEFLRFILDEIVDMLVKI